jgi:hypothetical protein
MSKNAYSGGYRPARFLLPGHSQPTWKFSDKKPASERSSATKGASFFGKGFLYTPTSPEKRRDSALRFHSLKGHFPNMRDRARNAALMSLKRVVTFPAPVGDYAADEREPEDSELSF